MRADTRQPPVASDWGATKIDQFLGATYYDTVIVGAPICVNHGSNYGLIFAPKAHRTTISRSFEFTIHDARCFCGAEEQITATFQLTFCLFDDQSFSFVTKIEKDIPH